MTDALEFIECDTCRAKPGHPKLCKGCLHNRAAISSYKIKFESASKLLDALDVIIAPVSVNE